MITLITDPLEFIFEIIFKLLFDGAMEFGKLEDIENVNWDLPPVSNTTIFYLENRPKPTEFQVYFGAPAWGHKEWVGKIYPEKSKATEFLYHYARKYNCIELNTTHYRIPTSEQAAKWVSQVPEGFLFCPKVYQSISHSSGGMADLTLLREWFQFLENLKGFSGPCLFQLPPYFEYSSKAILFNFLQQWPSEHQLMIELRHESWFEHGEVLPAFSQYLQSKNIGLVITDVAGRRDVVHTSISADYTFVRFIGNELHHSDFTRADAWASKFAELKSLGLQKLFLIIHEPNDICVPEMTIQFIEKINAACATNLTFSMTETENLQPKLL